MFEINWRILLLQVGNFTVLLLALRLLLFKPIAGIMKQRTDGIRNLLSDAARERTDAERLRREYESKMTAAATEAQQIIRQANQTGETIRSEIRLRAEQDREKLIGLTRAELEEQRRVVREQLAEKVSELAVDIAARTLEGLLDDEARKRLTSEMIRRIDRGSG